jgi:hypothetical protein
MASRLGRLERSWAAGGCGPGCPPVRAVIEADWYDDGQADAAPAPCPRCGRPPRVLGVVFDPDIYGNAERLRGATPTPTAGRGDVQ